MKNTNNTLAAVQLNQVIEQLTDLDNDDTIAIYNDYASNNGYELIFNNDEQTLNDTFLTPYDAIRQTNNKDYKDHENYFTFNGYGHAVSFDYRLSDNSPIDVGELAQWLINEDKISDYDIMVTTLEDMLASIEDNITDDSELLKKLTDYVDKSVFAQDALMINKYNECNDFIIHEYMNMLSNYDYNQLNGIINYLGINYQ